MKISFGHQQVELGGPQLGTDLRDSHDLLGDAGALRARMQEDGYVLLRGLLDRRIVRRARRTILEFMRDNGGAIVAGDDLMAGRINPEGKAPPLSGRNPITEHPHLKAVFEGKRLFDCLETYFGEPARTFEYKWLRAVGNSEFTGVHYDIVYMGRGSKRLHSCWVPFDDIAPEMGTLAICVGSHRLPGFAKLRRTYGASDVDDDRYSGWFSTDPIEIVERFGGSWQTSTFRMGDVIFFGMHTLHASTSNSTDRYRISADVRFQPAADPVDERWVGEDPKGEHVDVEELRPVSELRAKWGLG